MKKYVILIMLVLPFILFANSAGKLIGTVTDANNGKAILANIMLEVVEPAKGAATGPNGKFMIFKIEPGNYSVKFQTAGYRETIVKNVRVESGNTTELNIALSPDSEFELSKEHEDFYLK